MTPIISPWVFYWIEVLESISVVVGAIFVVGLITLMVCSVVFFVSVLSESGYNSDEENEKKIKTFLNFAKKSITILVILQIAATFIPSKETMYTMLVAQNVTVENLETATDVIKDGVDYIFDKFGENDE